MNEFGNAVAYQTRFERTKTASTRLLFLTDGLLLRQMAMNNNLPQYNVVILDEVHERQLAGDLLCTLQLAGDLLCTLLRDLVHRRPDFKLIVMSATINLKLFSEFFQDAPIIEVPGRLYPIELKYCPPPELDPLEKDSGKFDTAPYIKILDSIATKYSWSERGDVLVFLNGIAEISKCAEALKEYAEASRRWIILMLHSTLSVKEQNKVFDISPPGVRKVILSTNIAEASVTIDEVRFVIDSGKANLNYYNPKIRVTKLVTELISKASANQRKGRAGRTGPGICFRLYSEEQYDAMKDFTPSEINRSSLETLVLQILNMKLGIGAREFEYLEKPSTTALDEAINSLRLQRIIDYSSDRKLTNLGKIIADLPLDVLVAKLLIYSTLLNQVEVALTIAAGMSVQSPFTNRSWNDQECIKNRESLMSDRGDLFTLINIYREWLKCRRDGEDTKRWCHDRGLEETRLYEIVKMRHQLRNILIQSKLIIENDRKDLESMSKADRREHISRRKRIYRYRKDAQKNVEKRRRVLEAGRHFDTIAEDRDDEPSAEDKIQDLEFALLKDSTELINEIDSHRLKENLAVILNALISIGLYPQYAFDIQTHDYKASQEYFVRTYSRIFAAFHPHSSLSLNQDILFIKPDSNEMSPYFQTYFFGTFLEMKSQYLCNVSRVPALFSLIAARNVTRTDSKTIVCDSFLVLNFRHTRHADYVINVIVEIRRWLHRALEDKLQGEFPDSNDVKALIIELSRSHYPFGAKTPPFPDKDPHPGVFDENGIELVLNDNFRPPDIAVVDNDGTILKTERDSIKEELKEDAKKESKAKDLKKLYCYYCDKMIECENNSIFLKHRKMHENQSTN
uniref:ATP-dependent RNA helicase DHX34 n=1 Tax=Panagrolaimus sp. PS1159 TaxID=55785 RepID=A0AC35FSG0_9BILA